MNIVCASCGAPFDNGHGRHAPWCGHPYEQLIKDAVKVERDRCVQVAEKAVKELEEQQVYGFPELHNMIESMKKQ